MNMYEPTIRNITKRIQIEIENEIMKAVHECEIEVDKEELLKALKYDRDQYEKGYADGTAAIERVVERLEDPTNYTIMVGKHFTTIDRVKEIIKEEVEL